MTDNDAGWDSPIREQVLYDTRHLKVMSELLGVTEKYLKEAYFNKTRLEKLPRYYARLTKSGRKIKTNSSKAVYFFLLSSPYPVRFCHICEFLGMSKATVHRCLRQLHIGGLVNKVNWGAAWPGWTVYSKPLNYVPSPR